jgi:hypothetical protein
MAKSSVKHTIKAGDAPLYDNGRTVFIVGGQVCTLSNIHGNSVYFAPVNGGIDYRLLNTDMVEIEVNA